MLLKEYDNNYSGKEVPLDNRKKIVGYYFKNVQTLNQYKHLTWVEAEEYLRLKENNPDENITLKLSKTLKTKKGSKERIVMSEDIEDFEVTNEMLQLFGSGYRPIEYKEMWKKYNFIKESKPILNNLEKEALITYVRFKVREEMATANGDAVSAEKWSVSAMKAADKAKISPNQLSQSDLQGGLNSFSEFFSSSRRSCRYYTYIATF